ncbi:interferon regulatory factor 7 isoform X1 [Conger conger]|uniref:interferon regulatory factor 7 isoform X1 n=1 Tax=Conger conger TaxID=82655 RepID=UPI002A5A5F22|nr:interferon regulatory factor 7 isoform X1 [Conger conger]
MQSASTKPQFADWLIRQVNSGQYEGLNWVDNNKFRVPWKHNSRKDVSDEDSKIFKAWAEASGKIKENPNDRAKWKTNFRCALNCQKKFRMVEDQSKHPDYPHKVFQLSTSEYNYEEPPARDILMDSSCPLIEDLYNTDPVAMQEEELLNDMDGLTLNNQPQAGDHLWNDPYACNIPAVQNVYQPIEPQIMSQNHMAAPAVPPCGVAYPLLELTVQYRSREVLKTTLTSPRVQLHYLQEEPALQAVPVCFPNTEGLLDHKQIEYTQRILASVQRGLLLEVRGTGVYAVRQDKCHVFASTGASSQVPHPHPTKLPQKEEVELLNFQKFLSDLGDFQNNRQRSPEYDIYLCFGEKFPDGKPREKKLITVKVVPLFCRYLHEKAQAEGASSLHSGSISLQISHNSLFDLIESVYSMPSVEV